VALVKIPEASSLNRSFKVTERLEGMARDIPGVENTISLIGFDFLTGQLKPNSASCFIRLKDWKDRPSEEEHAKTILKNFYLKFLRFKKDLF
jgi:multidrug efflux pump subunit AcrB